LQAGHSSIGCCPGAPNTINRCRFKRDLAGKKFAVSLLFGGLNPKACPVEQEEAMGLIELTIVPFFLLKELS